MLVCTLGDLVLDVIVRLRQPLVAGDDVVARTAVGAGGQAANVAAWAVALGADARYVGRRGDDRAGLLVAGELEALGVELAGPVGGRTGVVVAVVGTDRDRSMASDRGSAAELSAGELASAWFQGADRLHVSGYLLAAEASAATAAGAATLARAGGARISVDVSSATLIRDTGPERFRAAVGALEPDVVFATETELDALGGPWPGAVTVLKRGANGCAVLHDGVREEHAAIEAELLDATGAGDAFAAGYLVGGPRLAVEAGSRCVSTVGAMP